MAQITFRPPRHRPIRLRRRKFVAVATTDVTITESTIGASGADYTTPAAWWTAECNGVDFVSTNVRKIGKLMDNGMNGTLTTTDENTSKDTNYAELTYDDSIGPYNWHTDTGASLSLGTNGTVLRLSGSDTRVTGLGFLCLSNTTSSAVVPDTLADGCTVRDCYITLTGTGDASNDKFNEDIDYWFINCIFNGRGVATTGIHSNSHRPHVINCDIFDFATGVHSASQNASGTEWRNLRIFDCSTASMSLNSSTQEAFVHNCAVDDTLGASVNDCYTSQALADWFDDYAEGVFPLPVGSDGIGGGTATNMPTHDHRGQARVTADIGAYGDIAPAITNHTIGASGDYTSTGSWWTAQCNGLDFVWSNAIKCGRLTDHDFTAAFTTTDEFTGPQHYPEFTNNGTAYDLEADTGPNIIHTGQWNTPLTMACANMRVTAIGIKQTYTATASGSNAVTINATADGCVFERVYSSHIGPGASFSTATGDYDTTFNNCVAEGGASGTNSAGNGFNLTNYRPHVWNCDTIRAGGVGLLLGSGVTTGAEIRSVRSFDNVGNAYSISGKATYVDSCAADDATLGTSANRWETQTTADWFTDIATNDLSIPAGSSAIDNGYVAGAPTTDYLGNARDASPDIGAFERIQTPIVRVYKHSMRPYRWKLRN